MRIGFAIPVTITCWGIGLFMGVLGGSGVSWFAVALTACAGLLIGPVAGTALIAALPEVARAERWRPGDLYLPALASSAAFSFVVAHVCYSSLTL
jgi:hypothetical protein